MRRVQSTMFGSPVVTWPRRGERYQQTIPGLDGLAVRQLEADSLREWMEARRAAEADTLPELEDAPELEG